MECAQSYPLHFPVLKEDTINFLNIHPDGIYLDGTIGYGGHASLIQSHLSDKGILIGLDGDEEALTHTKTVLASTAHYLFQDSYHNFPNYLISLGFIEIDGILLDLGLSSPQINSTDRGFSYQVNGPLDMRFSKTTSLTAREIVNQSDEHKLRDIIRQFGEEKYANKIARAIVDNRKKQPIETTFELRDIISSVIYKPALFKSLSRVFQSLRIVVNHELESLEKFLEFFINYLKVGGRAVIISYHSLEDRMVKHRFMEMAKGCICPPEVPICICGRAPILKILTRGVLRPTREEIQQNPRARSAKLRAVEKIS